MKHITEVDSRPDSLDQYYRFLLLGALAVGLVGAGIFLIVEHWVTWGYLEFELLGHETYGLVMVLGGLCIFILDWKRVRPTHSDDQG